MIALASMLRDAGEMPEAFRRPYAHMEMYYSKHNSHYLFCMQLYLNMTHSLPSERLKVGHVFIVIKDLW